MSLSKFKNNEEPENMDPWTSFSSSNAKGAQTNRGKSKFKIMLEDDDESVTSSSSGSRYEEQNAENEGLPVKAKRLFPQSPVTPAIAEKLGSQKEPLLSVKRLNTAADISSARKLDMLQKAVFTPLKGINHEPMSSTNYTNEENFVQPKILNIRISEAEKAELLRTKRSFIAAGPPQLKN
jgi:hypothetical protein